MSDTPRTDAATTQTGLIDKLFVNSDFARKLERELNEALEHQEVPFHTCGGKDCRNKYCQMCQKIERLEQKLKEAK